VEKMAPADRHAGMKLIDIAKSALAAATNGPKHEGYGDRLSRIADLIEELTQAAVA
jgi:hypothetical protein